MARKPKAPKGQFKLRCICNEWYVFKYPESGDPDVPERRGPFNFNTAKTRCETLARLGWTDADKGA